MGPGDAGPARWQDTGLLGYLDRVRLPWGAPVRRVVHAVLRQYLPDPPGPVVEVGAGGGQLRVWLPPHVAADTTHTEPSGPYLGVLRKRFRDAKTLQAAAAALPFPDGSLGAALALCVLDTVPGLPAVRDELRRVLRPGGVVVHFLDLGTSPDAAFPHLVAGGELPLTNFTADLGLMAGLSPGQRALVPAADEFDEVLAVGWPEFTRFVGMLEAARAPLVANLGPYANLAAPGALDPYRLGQGFMAARSDPDRLRAVNKCLLGLTLAAREAGRDWPLRPVSLRAHLRETLKAAFGPEHGFAVEFAGPVAAREAVRADRSTPRGVRFVLRHAGRTVSRSAVGDVPGTPVEALEGGVPAGLAGDVLRATTVEVFVARRLGG